MRRVERHPLIAVRLRTQVRAVNAGDGTLALQTSVPVLLAAGDVRHGSTKRAAGGVGEGAMAVALAHRRLDEIALGT